jgi:hypothetical protein
MRCRVPGPRALALQILASLLPGEVIAVRAASGRRSPYETPRATGIRLNVRAYHPALRSVC